MKKLLITTAFLALTACVEEGPPNYNERDRRVYNSLEDTNRHDHYDHDRDHDHDYDPNDGHDHWARQNN